MTTSLLELLIAAKNKKKNWLTQKATCFLCYLCNFLAAINEFHLSLDDYNCVSRKFKGCCKDVSRMVQEEFQRCFKSVLRKFKKYFKEIESCLEGVLMVVQWVLQEGFK